MTPSLELILLILRTWSYSNNRDRTSRTVTSLIDDGLNERVKQCYLDQSLVYHYSKSASPDILSCSNLYLSCLWHDCRSFECKQCSHLTESFLSTGTTRSNKAKRAGETCCREICGIRKLRWVEQVDVLPSSSVHYFEQRQLLVHSITL